MTDELRVAAAPGPQGRGSTALELVRQLPPEALVKVVDVMADVVRTASLLAERRAGFAQEMERLRETNVNRERVMSLLSDLLLGAALNDDHKLRLVDAICQLALR